jgi:PAS domain S-box-containing protein/excisionase family DNA binding protein
MTSDAVAPADPTRGSPGEQQDYYSVSQVAALLGVNRVTVWRWIRTGRLPASRVGIRTTRIARADLEQSLARISADAGDARRARQATIRSPEADGRACHHPTRLEAGGGDPPDAEEHRREIAVLQQQASALAARIAERERSEATLLRRQAELDDFVENAVIGLHRVGADGTILWANRAELDLLGYTREEYVGRPIAEFHADPATIGDILRRLSAREELHSYPARLRCKDGSVKHVVISSNALWEDGRFVHTRCFTRDVTDRVRADEGRALLARAGEVLTSSLDWDATLNHVIDLAMPVLADFGFFDVIEVDGTVRRIARAHDDPRRQAILDASRWVAADHTELNVCALTNGRTGFHPKVDDAWLRAASAGPEHLAAMRDLAFRSMVTVPLRHGDRTLGALTLFYADSARHHTEDDVALIEDLARRAAMAVENARLYGEAQAAIRARDEFLSIASHELRNPVAGMKGAAQLLRRLEQRGLLDGKQLDRYVGIIEQTANRLAALTEDLLDVSRLQQGVLPMRPQQVDVVALVQTVVDRLQEQNRTHTLVPDLGETLEPIRIDPDRIEQVVENLLGNAIKYTPSGGEVRVALLPDAEGVVLSVRDTGIGLPEGASERIFEPFGRASNALARNIEGLGLGLYICRRIAEQHGGRLWAESAGEGKGTTMRLWLPCSR